MIHSISNGARLPENAKVNKAGLLATQRTTRKVTKHANRS